MSPLTRALAATTLFVIAGASSVFLHDSSKEVLYPHALFYTVLTINTFFSVRFFSTFTPKLWFQSAVDALLVVSYIALALSIGAPLAFTLWALIIFVIAPVKYAQMLGKTSFDATLRKKIRIDVLGTALCALVVTLTLIGYVIPAAWLLALVFAIANVYLLVINPMYRHVTK